MLKKNVLTTGQVAKLCNVAPRTVTKWFDSGRLKGYRIPGSKDRRIPQDELIRFMKNHNIPTDAIVKGKLRILIIDSRIDFARKLSENLHTKGSFDIHCAHNSFDAGLMALKTRPNIILIDFLSNDIDALEICRYVKDNDELNTCSVIALAAGLSEKETLHLTQQGFDTVVSDFGNIDAVLSSIAETLEIFS